MTNQIKYTSLRPDSYLCGEWEGGPVNRLTTPVGWLQLFQLTVLSRFAIAVLSNFFVALFVLSLCPIDISVGVEAFVIGLSQISSFLSLVYLYVVFIAKGPALSFPSTQLYTIITKFRDVLIENLQRVRLANKGRLLIRTSDPVPFGTCIYCNVENFFNLISLLNLSCLRTWNIGHPTLLLFCLALSRAKISFDQHKAYLVWNM